MFLIFILFSFSFFFYCLCFWYPKELLLNTMSKRFMPKVYSVFIISAHFIYFDLFLYIMWNRAPASLFCMWISSCLSKSCWTICFSLGLTGNFDTCLTLRTTVQCIGEGNGNPLQCSCLETPRDGGAWWAAIHGVTQSRTWLKRLSSSSSSTMYANSSL